MSDFFHHLRGSRLLRVVLGMIISALALYLAVRDISVSQVGQALARADWLYLILALFCVGIHHWIKAVRWDLFLNPIQAHASSRTRFSDLFLTLMAGQMLNLVFPGRVGDISRIVVIGNRGAGKAATAGTIVLEKAVDTIFYAFLAVMLAFLVVIPDWLAGALFGLVGVMVALWFVLFLFGRQHAWSQSLETWLVEQQARLFPAHAESTDIASLLRSFRLGLSGSGKPRSWRSPIIILLCSALAWGMSLSINGLVARGLGIAFTNVDEALAATILVLLGLQAGISIPSVPGRVGIFEYICVLALGVFQISPSIAFSFGLLLHVIVMLPVMLTGWASLVILGLDTRQVVREHAEG